MNKDYHRIRKFSFFLGLLVVIASLVCNQFFLAPFFTVDGEIELTDRGILYLLQSLAFIWGVLTMFSSKYSSRLLSLMYGFVFVVILFCVVETIFFFVSGNDEAVIVLDFEEDPYVWEGTVGYSLKPNLHIETVKTYDGDTIFDVIYSTDKYGKRCVPCVDSVNPEKFVVIAGCSVAFGTGLNDNENLTGKLTQLQSDFKVYNYGVEGYGTHQVYTMIKEGRMKFEIPETNGIMIYLFIEEHINRSIGSMGVYNLWAKDLPYYEMKEDNLILNGTFTTGRKIRSCIYKILGKSNILKSFDIDWPTCVTEEQFQLVVRLISESKKEFLKQYPKGEFIVEIAPSENDQSHICDLIKKAGVKVFDYSNLYQQYAPGYFIQNDGHPTTYACEILAKQMVKDLKEY